MSDSESEYDESSASGSEEVEGTEESTNETSDESSSESSSEEEEVSTKKSKSKIVKNPEPTKRKFKRINPVEDSSDDEEQLETIENSTNNSVEEVVENEEEHDSNFEIPETDDDEVPESMNRSVKNRRSFFINNQADETSDEEENLKRKSRYEAEYSEEEEEPVLPKVTRRSINPTLFKQKSMESETEESSSDDEVIVDEQKEQPINDSRRESVLKFNKSIAEKLSSTLYEVAEDSNEKSDSSSGVLHVSGNPNETIEIAESSNEEAAAINPKIRHVSKSEYNAKLAEKQDLERSLNRCIQLQDHAKSLPDKGAKLNIKTQDLLAKIDKLSNEIQMCTIDENLSIKNQIVNSFKNEHKVLTVDSSDDDVIPVEAYVKVDDVQPKHFGKIGMKHFEAKKALTVETLERLHGSVEQRPNEDELDEAPKYLKLELMDHQLHALKFMRWRETKEPKGGILADDMGLGKTLTTISLILRQLQIEEDKEEEESDEDSDKENENRNGDWKSKGRRDYHKGGTLIICPASLVNQWNSEIVSKVKRGALDVNLFHGPKRIFRPKELASFDVVITSYETVSSEFKNEGCLGKIKFDRIVLDEGHVIRNHKSKKCLAVCALEAKCRWVLSGTPVQNKEFDLYAVIKFLRCTPFDSIDYWKQFVEVKNGSSPRVQALLKAIMLRRTKEHLIQTKKIESLPEKKLIEVKTKLTTEERYIHNRLMTYSKGIVAQYLAQKDTANNHQGYAKERFNAVFQTFQRQYNRDQGDVQQHDILVLLLRLRQVCCHPGLIKEMVEKTDLHGEENNHSNPHETSDIIRALEEMNLREDNQKGEDIWDTEHGAFDLDEPSSKMLKMLEILKKEIMPTKGKVVIVSQWVKHLDVIKNMLNRENIASCDYNGTVQVKLRNSIVENFNDPKSSVRVMLLSLNCGGVGLNLVGANYMFIMDLHWNPQLEKQGQDRIYRFGQKQNVQIYKFICTDTIEERILLVQNNKISVAEGTLTGAKVSGSKITLHDLMTLFGM